MANFRTLKIHKDSYMLAKFYLAENQLQTGSLIFFLFVINQIYMHVADKGQYIYKGGKGQIKICLLYTSPSPRDVSASRMPSSA